MTLEIKITVPEAAVSGDKADRYVSTALAAIGYAKATQSSVELKVEPTAEWLAEFRSLVRSDLLPIGDGEEQASELADAQPELSSDAPAQLRPRGSAGEGRRRRTKAEIAEDEALEAAARAAGVDLALVDEKLAAGHSRDEVMAGLSEMATGKTATSDASTMQISSGENRVGPDDPTEDDAAQDAADEAAEAAAGRDANAGPTHADLTAAVGRYQKKYGMEAAIADTPVILGKAIADVPKDELPAAIAAVFAAIEGGRPGAGATPQEAQVEPATKAQVGEALTAYARKFDGPGFDMTDATTYPNMLEDGRKVFSMLFGDGVTKLGQIPDSGDGVAYGRALAGILEMTEKNPFKREAK